MVPAREIEVVVVVETSERDAQNNHVIRKQMRCRESQRGGAGVQTAGNDGMVTL